MHVFLLSLALRMSPADTCTYKWMDRWTEIYLRKNVCYSYILHRDPDSTEVFKIIHCFTKCGFVVVCKILLLQFYICSKQKKNTQKNFAQSCGGWKIRKLSCINEWNHTILALIIFFFLPNALKKILDSAREKKNSESKLKLDKDTKGKIIKCDK